MSYALEHVAFNPRTLATVLCVMTEPVVKYHAVIRT
jgi:hypothetical protein